MPTKVLFNLHLLIFYADCIRSVNSHKITTGTPMLIQIDNDDNNNVYNTSKLDTISIYFIL